MNGLAVFKPFSVLTHKVWLVARNERPHRGWSDEAPFLFFRGSFYPRGSPLGTGFRPLSLPKNMHLVLERGHWEERDWKKSASAHAKFELCLTTTNSISSNFLSQATW